MNEFCSDGDSNKVHSSDAKSHLFDGEMNKTPMNFKNDTNNNSSNQQDIGTSSMKERDDSPSVPLNDQKSMENGTTSPKLKTIEPRPSESPTNSISQFLNSIINFRRDEMQLNLNNLLSGGANQIQPTSSAAMLNDLNRNFLAAGFGAEHMNHALTSLVAGHQQYSKYGRGTCKWPGCDMIFDDLQTFTK